MDIIFSIFLIYLLFLLSVGYFLPFITNQKLAIRIAWAITLVTVLFSIEISAGMEAPVRMLMIVVLQLVAMKIVVVAQTYAFRNGLTCIQWAAFCGWFGMRPEPFEKLSGPSLPFVGIIWKGFYQIVIGLILLYFSMILEQSSEFQKFFIPQLSLLAGFSLILHFGLLNLCTAAWRIMGVKVFELFQSPQKSRSLKEFWGKRWNIAFSEMTAIILYRPLKKNIGMDKALMVSFLLSGLLHEMAISFPVRSGFGLPMFYFSIHAFAMYLEANAGLIQRMLKRKWFPYLWVNSLLLLPLPLLFHHEFVQQVLKPLRTIVLESIAMI